MLERLPTPWGLVRLGVAPDHPKLKTVSRAFERIADKPGFRFLGNVEVGRDLHHDDLARLYDAVVYAVGAQTDRRLGIPGEDLPGSWSAIEFVAWYNGHPDFQDLAFDLDVERAVVIGNGNVALDVARMLALHARGARADRHDRRGDRGDLARRASARSSCSGAAGPAQAAFTPPELGELGELAGADVVVDPAELERDASEARRRRASRRNLEVLRELRVARADRQAEDAAPALPRRRRSRSTATTASRRSRSCATGSRSATARLVAVADGRARDDPVRPRLPQRRLPRRRAARRPVRRGARHDPQRRRPRPRRRGRARCGRLLRRLDQARPDRR